MSNTSNTILIIGGPNAGKTHFGGQLYGRLSAKSSHYKITSTPDDLSIFQEVWDNLNEGKSSGHTHVNAHKTLKLEVESEIGGKSVFSFPDYGGEQVKAIVNDRRVNKAWKEQVEASNSWMLFIRLDDLWITEDIVNRGLPEQEVLEKRTEKAGLMVLSDTAFFIELIQILLHVKRISTKQRITNPKLTIVLSCWDLLPKEDQNKSPEKILSKKLPGLFNFIANTWSKESWNTIGLSSTGKSLSNSDSDIDFVKLGPESFGYIVTEKGEKKIDLTLTISKSLE